MILEIRMTKWLWESDFYQMLLHVYVPLQYVRYILGSEQILWGELDKRIYTVMLAVKCLLKKQGVPVHKPGAERCVHISVFVCVCEQRLKSYLPVFTS